MTEQPAAPAARRIRVWDLPTRLAHALLIVLVPFSWWSIETDHLPWHRLSGYAVMTVLLFRIVWGFVGSDTARFTAFVRGPKAIVAYVRGEGVPAAGHSPLGALSILAMLMLLSLQVGLGLFTVDEDGIDPSPLAKFVDFDTGRLLAKIHHLNFTAIQVLIGLHLLAIAIYALRGRNLTGPMITGSAPAREDMAEPRRASLLLAALIAAGCAAVAWFVARGLKV